MNRLKQIEIESQFAKSWEGVQRSCQSFFELKRREIAARPELEQRIIQWAENGLHPDFRYRIEIEQFFSRACDLGFNTKLLAWTSHTNLLFSRSTNNDLPDGKPYIFMQFVCDRVRGSHTLKDTKEEFETNLSFSNELETLFTQLAAKPLDDRPYNAE